MHVIFSFQKYHYDNYLFFSPMNVLMKKTRLLIFLTIFLSSLTVNANTDANADLINTEVVNLCPHPLDPLNKAEIELAVNLVKAKNLSSQTFFPTVVLNEPPKQEILNFKPGDSFKREAIVEAFDRPQNILYKAIVDLQQQKVIAFDKMPEGTQPPSFENEYTVIPALVSQDSQWRAAMKKRGVEPEDVYLDLWSGGDLAINTDREGQAVAPGTRIMRVLSFLRGQQANPYDRPIEGVVVAVDMNHLKILQVTDTVIAPVSNYDGLATQHNRKPLKPLQIVQSSGEDFQTCGHEIRWQGWRFRYVLHPRDGLVIYTLGYEENGKVRAIAYRLGLTEIYVPYGVPDSNWVWRTAFDVGEYGMGRFVNPLIAEHDVPNNAKFFNARIADDHGGSIVYPNAVGIYERNAGLLWKRVDPSSNAQDLRGARELVLTSNSWIGNYIYAVHFIFQMNGSLEVRIDATGTTLNQGVNSLEAGAKYGRIVDKAITADGKTALVAAPNHQHFFNFRADLDIDGTANRVYESNVFSQTSELNNAFASEEFLLSTESSAKRDIDLKRARSWKILSSQAKNDLGSPTGYTLYLGDTATPYANSNFAARKRAGFIEYPLWVTRYHADELYATGAYPNQGQASQGLPFYSNSEELGDQDSVLWITAGLTHVPDVEQYPVMNTESLQVFRLVPYGFFRRNPALDLTP
jgi:primary-amine oxidase